jgi:hypothetical protein
MSQTLTHLTPFGASRQNAVFIRNMAKPDTPYTVHDHASGTHSNPVSRRRM